jgi:hypothetical protein
MRNEIASLSMQLHNKPQFAINDFQKAEIERIASARMKLKKLHN